MGTGGAGPRLPPSELPPPHLLSTLRFADRRYLLLRHVPPRSHYTAGLPTRGTGAVSLPMPGSGVYSTPASGTNAGPSDSIECLRRSSPTRAGGLYSTTSPSRRPLDDRSTSFERRRSAPQWTTSSARPTARTASVSASASAGSSSRSTSWSRIDSCLLASERRDGRLPGGWVRPPVPPPTPALPSSVRICGAARGPCIVKDLFTACRSSGSPAREVGAVPRYSEDEDGRVR